MSGGLRRLHRLSESPVVVEVRASERARERESGLSQVGEGEEHLEDVPGPTCSSGRYNAMATATAWALPSPSALAESRASSARQQPPARHGVGLPPLSTPTPAAPLQSRAQRAGAYSHMIARNVIAMSAGESVATTTTVTVVSPEEPVATAVVTGEAPAEGTTDLPEIVKTIQQAWDKVEDKYAVSSLAFAGAVALWGTAGMMSAIDRLPLVPGVLEIVGIGYTGWFAYKNLFFKPDREAVIGKAKSIYNDIIGGS